MQNSTPQTNQKNKGLVSIIIVSWKSAKYIRACLNSVIAQNYQPIEIIFLDNCSPDDSAEIVAREYPAVTTHRAPKNLGFSQGNNLAASKAKGEYLLFLNQDVVIEPDFVSKQVAVLEQDQKVASTQGKLLKYDFDTNQKKDIIDCAGIHVFRSRRMIDYGQGEPDQPRYNRPGEIFAGTGAALLCRRSALTEVAPTGEIFDTDFWAYKEDIDLGWRLRLFGWTCRYVPSAVGYHGRTSNKSKGGSWRDYVKNERTKPAYVREVSTRNHFFLLFKNETCATLAPDLLPFLSREIQLLGYHILFAPRLLKAYFTPFAKLPRLIKKRRFIQRHKKVPAKEIRKFFRS